MWETTKTDKTFPDLNMQQARFEAAVELYKHTNLPTTLFDLARDLIQKELERGLLLHEQLEKEQV